MANRTIAQRIKQEDMFLRRLFGILARMAKVDGKVDAWEVHAVEGAFVRFPRAGARRKFCVSIFNSSKNGRTPLRSLAADFEKEWATPEDCLALYELLWDVACAKGVLKPSHKNALRDLCVPFGLLPNYFIPFFRWRSSSFREVEEEEPRRESRTRKGRKSTQQLRKTRQRRDHPRTHIAQHAIRRDHEPQAALVSSGRMEVSRPPAARRSAAGREGVPHQRLHRDGHPTSARSSSSCPSFRRRARSASCASSTRSCPAISGPPSSTGSTPPATTTSSSPPKTSAKTTRSSPPPAPASPSTNPKSPPSLPIPSPPKGTITTLEIATFCHFSLFEKRSLYFPLKCDTIHMFFDRGTMPLNGERGQKTWQNTLIQRRM